MPPFSVGGGRVSSPSGAAEAMDRKGRDLGPQTRQAVNRTAAQVTTQEEAARESILSTITDFTSFGQVPIQGKSFLDSLSKLIGLSADPLDFINTRPLGAGFESLSGMLTPEESILNSLRDSNIPREFEGDEDGGELGLSQDIQSFLGGGGPAPQVDAVSALNALQQALAGIQRSELDFRGRDLTGQGFADPARTQVQDIFNQLQPGQNIEDLLNELGGFNLGRGALQGAQGEAVTGNIASVNEAFPTGFATEAFQPIDDSIIQSIIDERRGPVSQQISNAAARGNLSEQGALTANQALIGQEPGARERLGELGSAVSTESQGLGRGIREEAFNLASGFVLGDEPFDVSPFTQQFTDLQSERIGGQGENIRSLLGSEPLFQTSDILRTGGGIVSGASPNENFLDAIAARESSARRDRRGLGVAGSGAF